MKTSLKAFANILGCTVFWLVLGWNALTTVAGATFLASVDGSGHVAAMHTYSAHIYPAVHGMLPEFFGGMPFPVFYPPLFYFLGASLMHSFNLTATVAAKLILVSCFTVFPCVLWLTARALKLSRWEASLASCTVGILCTRATFVALYSVGMTGVFEVGFYTHLLGFIFFLCFIAAFARFGYHFITVLSLSATLLTNLHLYVLIALFSCAVITEDLVSRKVRSGDLQNSRAIIWTSIGALSLTAFWWVPLVRISHFAIGVTEFQQGFLSAAGFENVLIVFPLIAVFDKRVSREMRYLSISLTLAYALCFAPALLGDLPFQPGRAFACVLLLSVFPAVKLISAFPNDRLARPFYYCSCCVALLALLSVTSPISLVAASFSGREAGVYSALLVKMRELPRGAVLTEIADQASDPALLSSNQGRREIAGTRLLPHLLAEEGWPVLWTVFREQSLAAPVNASVRNLFSRTHEGFGLGGVAIEVSTQPMPSNRSISLARSIRTKYILVESTVAVLRARNSEGIRELWAVGDWHCFELIPNELEKTPLPLMIASWLPAKYRNRSSVGLDAFNVAEMLFMSGRADIHIIVMPDHEPTLLRGIAGAFDAIVFAEQSLTDGEKQSVCEVIRRMPDRSSIVAIGPMESLRPCVSKQNVAIVGSSVEDVVQALGETISSHTKTIFLHDTPYFKDLRTSDGAETFLTGLGRTGTVSDSPLVVVTTNDQRLGGLVSGCSLVFMTLSARLKVRSPRRLS